MAPRFSTNVRTSHQVTQTAMCGVQFCACALHLWRESREAVEAVWSELCFAERFDTLFKRNYHGCIWFPYGSHMFPSWLNFILVACALCPGWLWHDEPGAALCSVQGFQSGGLGFANTLCLRNQTSQTHAYEKNMEKHVK